jgi:uncharacterized protein YjiS (DUF1127 family)
VISAIKTIRFSYSRRFTMLSDRQEMQEASMSDSTIIRFGGNRGDAFSSGPANPLLASIVSRAVAWVVEAGRRYRTRRALAQLDGMALKDIGLNAAEADYEASKPFWRA